MITIFRVWDRKSPRHKWHILAEVEDENRARTIIEYQKRSIKQTPGWEQGEIGFEKADTTGGMWFKPAKSPTYHRPSIQIMT